MRIGPPPLQLQQQQQRIPIGGASGMTVPVLTTGEVRGTGVGERLLGSSLLVERPLMKLVSRPLMNKPQIRVNNEC